MPSLSQDVVAWKSAAIPKLIAIHGHDRRIRGRVIPGPEPGPVRSDQRHHGPDCGSMPLCAAIDAGFAAPHAPIAIPWSIAAEPSAQAATRSGLAHQLAPIAGQPIVAMPSNTMSGPRVPPRCDVHHQSLIQRSHETEAGLDQVNGISSNIATVSSRRSTDRLVYLPNTYWTMPIVIAIPGQG